MSFGMTSLSLSREGPAIAGRVSTLLATVLSDESSQVHLGQCLTQAALLGLLCSSLIGCKTQCTIDDIRSSPNEIKVESKGS